MYSHCALAIPQLSSCLSWGIVQGVSWGLFLSKLVIFLFRYFPTLHIRDFHVRYCRTPPFYWEVTVSVCIMTMSFLFFHLLFFSSCILLAYFSSVSMCAPLCDTSSLAKRLEGSIFGGSSIFGRPYLFGGLLARLRTGSP
jgi:hypothetical protein